jgi:hypothetical protein
MRDLDRRRILTTTHHGATRSLSALKNLGILRVRILISYSLECLLDDFSCSL